MGILGERIEITAKVTKIKELEGAFGMQTLYVLEDICGNVYIWITTSQKTVLEENEEYNLRGTVKAHKTYKGVNQTILTRCNIIKEK